MTLLLRILVALLMVQALVKFGVFFAVGYKTRRKMLDAQYGARTTATKQSDLLLLGLVVTLLGLLLGTGEVEYLSFAVGLWCGMTLIQTYFHEFSTPLAPEHRPADAEMSPIKLMSYAHPGRSCQAMEGARDHRDACRLGVVSNRGRLTPCGIVAVTRVNRGHGG